MTDRNEIHIKADYVCTVGPRHSSRGLSLASHRGGPGSNPGLVMWDLLCTKCRCGRFSPSSSVSPANLQFHQFSPQSPSPIIRGWYNRPVVAAVPKFPPHKLEEKFGQLSTMDHWRSRCKGWIFMAHSLYIYTSLGSSESYCLSVYSLEI
jgi:hypothetical protein